jgi:tetratricopeptide (TPR) repeat protein
MRDSEASPETIGTRLRRLRRERGFSQRELASPGVSYAYISRIEAGTRQPSVKALRMLARKLGVSADYLETGSELAAEERRELEIANAELELRLDESSPKARTTLESLLDEAVAAGDSAAATRARAVLGLSAFESGDFSRTVELLEEVVPAVEPSMRPDVYATLGRAYSALGSPQRAVDIFERSMTEIEAEAPDDVPTRIRFAAYLSAALTDLGEFERAHTLLRDVLDETSEFVDPYSRVRLYWSLARVAGFQGRLSTALENYRRAIALLEATEDTLHLARAHIGCAWTLNAAGRGGESRKHLDAAEELLGARPQLADLASLRTEQAKAALQLGENDEAAARATEAIELLADSEPAEQGIAWVTLAEAQAAKGEIAEADESFRRATTLLGENERNRETAQAYRSWAKLLREAGREAEALDALERATDYAVRTQSSPVASAKR